MARKRMIDPSFWIDEKIGTCEPIARILFMGLISQADDEGRLNGHPALIKSLIFPYDNDLSLKKVEELLELLTSRKLILRYEIDQQKYIFITNFKKHQTINRPQESKLPSPNEEQENTNHGTVSEQSVNDHAQKKLIEVKLKEDKLSKNNIVHEGTESTKTIPPNIEDVKNYCEERKNNVDPESWYDHYEAKGWMIGKNKMKDWKAGVRTWEKGNQKKGEIKHAEFRNSPRDRRNVYDQLSH